MKKYRVEFKTSISQEKPFVKVVEASMRDTAIAMIKAEAQITDRFIVSCKAVK